MRLNKSLQATRDGRSSPASRFTLAGTACLGSSRWPLRTRMTNSKHKWYTPVFLFAWASGWTYSGIHLLAGGEEWFAWYGGAPRILLRPDTHPHLFWGCVSVAFVFALVGAWTGIV